MGEYINRAKVDYEFMTTRGGGDVIVNLYERILDIPTADVVECSEYELIRRQLAQAFDRIAELDKLNGKLHSKIDKVIEAIENNRQLYEVSMDYTDGAKEQAYSEVLEILKINIGD